MSISLQAAVRADRKPEEIRANGSVPAVVYGPHMDALSIQVPATALDKAYDQAGESTIIELQFEKRDPLHVLVQDLQIHPVKRNIVHMDFKQVTMGEAMDVSIELNFIGVAPAVKSMGGILNTSKDSITVSCLPKDLVDHIDVDLSVLESFDKSIHVEDIKLPEGMTLLDNPSDLVVKVLEPISEEELEASLEASTEVNMDDVDSEEKGKKEDGEGEAEEGKKEEKSEGEKKE